jgi:hypothetical protein
LGVFVNCPFDDEFQDALDAIIFACVHAGFVPWMAGSSGDVPWMAGSSGDVAVPRVERIVDGIRLCRYSIHDLTRYQGQGADNLSRFNMPLELGIAMAHRALEGGDERHDWMVMVPDGHAYQKYISDLAGFDPKTHDASPERVAGAVLSWLATRPTASVTVSPDEVLPKLSEYRARRRELDAEWGSGANTPWKQILELALRVAAI